MARCVGRADQIAQWPFPVKIAQLCPRRTFDRMLFFSGRDILIDHQRPRELISRQRQFTREGLQKNNARVECEDRSQQASKSVRFIDHDRPRKAFHFQGLNPNRLPRNTGPGLTTLPILQRE
jgi:hypothetical protein